MGGSKRSFASQRSPVRSRLAPLGKKKPDKVLCPCRASSICPSKAIASREPFIASSNPKKWLADKEKAQRDTIALSGHLVSALDLSQLPNEERAAALVEALRHVGRSFANSASIGQSDATAVCLTAVNPHYERPEWFVDRLATWLRLRVEEDTRKALGAGLMEDGGGF